MQLCLRLSASLYSAGLDWWWWWWWWWWWLQQPVAKTTTTTERQEPAQEKEGRLSLARQRRDSAAAAATRDHATTTDLIEGEGGENRRLSSIFPVFAEVFRSPIECPLSHSLRQRLSSPPSGPGPCSLREVPVLPALKPSSPALSPPPLLLLLLPLATLRVQTVCVCVHRLSRRLAWSVVVVLT